MAFKTETWKIVEISCIYAFKANIYQKVLMQLAVYMISLTNKLNAFTGFSLKMVGESRLKQIFSI